METGFTDAAPNRTPPRWWSTFDDRARWHGVFQGGGAKGVAYVAPLRVMARKGQWFCSTAGSSAGAITAALVASGFHPDELADMTADLLREVRPDAVADAVLYRIKPFRRLTRYSLERLESAVEQRLRAGVARHGGDGSRTITFADLAAATEISLYVLTLDASLGRPLPFCAERTPDLSVSAAVAASCSIPLVFPPRYVQTSGSVYTDSFPVFRRLVDGGAWANFPAFIYNDSAFREFFGLAPMPDDAKVMGFVFESKVDAPLPSTPVRFTEDPHDHIDWYGARLLLEDPSRRASSDEDDFDDSTQDPSEPAAPDDEIGFIDQVKWRLGLVRQVAPEALAYTVVAALLLSLILIVVDAVSAHQWSVAALGGIAFLIALFATWLGRRLVKPLTREGADTFRSLIGLATAPPVWAGIDPRVLMIWVPPGTIDTTDFRLSKDDIQRTVQRAERFVDDQIAQALRGETFYALNRRQLTEMQLPEADFTPFEEVVPTHALRSLRARALPGARARGWPVDRRRSDAG
jgi:predicted acylesterase/phospholipase RssA